MGSCCHVSLYSGLRGFRVMTSCIRMADGWFPRPGYEDDYLCSHCFLRVGKRIQDPGTLDFVGLVLWGCVDQ